MKTLFIYSLISFKYIILQLCQINRDVDQVDKAKGSRVKYLDREFNNDKYIKLGAIRISIFLSRSNVWFFHYKISHL